MIRLGSRVDLFVPSTALQIVAKKGDRVLAGTTTLAMVRAADGGDRKENDQAGARKGGRGGADDP